MISQLNYSIAKTVNGKRTGDQPPKDEDRLYRIFQDMDLGSFLIAYRKTFVVSLKKYVPQPDLDDLVQTVYCKALAELGSVSCPKDFFIRFESPGKLKNWLGRIAHNEYISTIRSENVSARNNKLYADWVGYQIDPFENDPTGLAVSPLDRTACTHALSGIRRQIIDMLFDGSTQREVASSLGLSKSTVSRMTRGIIADIRTQIARMNKSYTKGKQIPNLKMYT